MRGIYLDNGATSFPKAPGVVESMINFLSNIGANVNRGAYDSSFEAENIVFETRELLCQLFHFDRPENVVFTKNITESLNVLIKGLVGENDHVIVSSMEHNAVMRPLNSLEKLGVEVSKIPCSKEGDLDPDDLKEHIRPNTKAVIMTHASNVCGTILDLEGLGRFCKEHHLAFIIDSAQSAGFLDVDIRRLNADAIAFTGHKGLFGPQGIGGFVIKDELAQRLATLIEGGTGSLSEMEVQPDYMPDKFEAGTLNIPGIYGLNAALKYILDLGVDTIRERELQMVGYFLDGLGNMPQIEIIGKRSTEGRTAVVSIDIPGKDNGEVSHRLYREYGISTRCGLHCAPSAHRTLGTFPRGTIRFSFSHFNRMEDAKHALDALYQICRGH